MTENWWKANAYLAACMGLLGIALFWGTLGWVYVIVGAVAIQANKNARRYLYVTFSNYPKVYERQSRIICFSLSFVCVTLMLATIGLKALL